METLQRHNDEFMDKVEVLLSELPAPDIKHFHFYAPGVYVRAMFLPEASGLTSRVHKTMHPFIVAAGVIEISVDGEKSEILSAPYHGITAAGTRRLGVALTPVVWTTVHALPYITGNEKDLDEAATAALMERIENDLLEPYTNKLLKSTDYELGSSSGSRHIVGGGADNGRQPEA